MKTPRRLSPYLPLCLALAALPLACGGGGGGNGGGNGGTVAGGVLDVRLDGSTTAYGTQVSGMSSGNTVEIKIRNQGSEAFSLSPVLLEADDDLDVRDWALTFPSNYVAPSGPQSGFSLADSESPLMVQQEDPVFGLTLQPDAEAMKDLAQREEGTLLLRNFALPGANSVDLELTKIADPWTDDALLLVDGEHQAELLQQVQQDYSAWTGRIAGQPHSNVFLSFSSHGCQGWLQGHDGIYHMMAQPVAVRDWRNPQVRIMREQAMFGPGGGVDRVHSCEPVRIAADAMQQRSGGGAAPNGTTDSPESKSRHSSSSSLSGLCRMALETDYDYLGLKFGDDQAAATTYATQLIAAVGHQFQEQVQTRLTLAYLALYTTSDDPWEIPDTGGTVLQLLEEFREAWLSNWPVEAEAAHLLCSGMNAGGVSYLDEVGDPRWAFSVSTFIQGNIDWGNFSFNPGGFTWDFIVVAHETGHLFNADHTHNYCPPFDECAKSSAWGTCQDETDCSSRGTLLSYCHTCPGSTNKVWLEFEPYIANQMRIAADTHLDAWTIQPGQTLTFEVEYDPLKSGASAMRLSWVHNASNASSPFLVEFSGSD